MNKNTIESGFGLITLDVKGKTYVVLLTAASVRCSNGNIWGSIKIDANGMSYTGCPGGKTNQRDSKKFWEKLFPKSGFAELDPNGQYILDTGEGHFETGSEVVLREVKEELLDSKLAQLITEDSIVKQLVEPGGDRSSWKGKSIQSTVCIGHIHVELSSEEELIGIIRDFNRRSLEGLLEAERIRDRVTEEEYFKRRPEYSEMVVVPAHQYYQRLIQASTHLNNHFRGDAKYPGYPCWIETFPGVLCKIAIRKWDLFVLTTRNMPNTKNHDGSTWEVMHYLESILSVTNKQKL